jgi:hypothetical protein
MSNGKTTSGSDPTSRRGRDDRCESGNNMNTFAFGAAVIVLFLEMQTPTVG